MNCPRNLGRAVLYRPVEGAMQTDIREGRVSWDPARSLWFATVALVAVVGAVPAAIRSPSAVVLFVVTSMLTMCAGHSVGIHRGLIHRAYRVPRWLEHVLVYVGVLVGLGGPIGLVRMHNTRDFQQNRPRCHDYFAHRQPLWRDYFWNLHCRFALLPSNARCGRS
jgi:stearoyl-CoA desaturase (delta-9 desaturase)